MDTGSRQVFLQSLKPAVITDNMRMRCIIRPPPLCYPESVTFDISIVLLFELISPFVAFVVAGQRHKTSRMPSAAAGPRGALGAPAGPGSAKSNLGRVQLSKGKSPKIYWGNNWLSVRIRNGARLKKSRYV